MSTHWKNCPHVQRLWETRDLHGTSTRYQCTAYNPLVTGFIQQQSHSHMRHLTLRTYPDGVNAACDC